MRQLVTAFCCAATLLAAQEIRLSTGASDNQVYQRGQTNSADLKLGGTAERLTGKIIEARLTSAGKPVRGFGWKQLTTISGATWTGELRNIPVGGPYTLELRAPGAVPVLAHDLLVGDLWILAGQSNMEGVGDLFNVQQPDSRVHSFTMYDEWVLAKEPLHELPAAKDSVHWGRGQTAPLQGAALADFREKRRKGAGVGLPFAAEMVKRTGVPIGLIPCAHGGTSMAQWDPALKDKGGQSLYGAMYRRFLATGTHVKGVLWYQGEAEAGPKAEPLFRTNFTSFIEAVRRDFSQPDLPFYYVQIGRFINTQNQEFWNGVQNSQRVLESQISKTGVAPSVDYALDDIIHISTQSHKQLALRLANLVTRDLFPELKQYAAISRGPRIRKVTYVAGTGNTGTVRISFAEVNGALTSNGRPTGFSIHGSDGNVIPAIYRVDLEGSNVLLQVQTTLPADATLSYGSGKDPYCNLTDAAGMGMLAFSAVPISR